VNNPLDRESLRDLDGVRVAVEELTPGARTRGLSPDQLQQDVESQLRQAGVTVLHMGDFPVGDPYLRVRVAVTPEEKGLIGYEVELDFAQIVFMRRNPAVTFNRAQTWKADRRMGLVPPARLADAVRRELRAQVVQYLADYRAVNPA
jgi:hypothetical protein